MDLALKHNQVAFQNFLEPKKAKASTELEPRYAIDERNLVWAQRKRRKAVGFNVCSVPPRASKISYRRNDTSPCDHAFLIPFSVCSNSGGQQRRS